MEDNRQEIKNLWLTGLSAKQIGVQLGLSRNAVIGKIYRMREAGEIGVRDSDSRMHSIRATTKKLEAERVLTLFDLMRETPFEKEEPQETAQEILIIAPSKTEEPSGTPIKFDQLTFRSCRYVLNDGDPQNFLFCGKIKNGRSYCKEHEAICYYRIDRKGKQQ